MGQWFLGLGCLLRAVDTSPAFLAGSPEVHALAPTGDGEFPFQSFCTKKGFLFVTAGYLMVTTSPVILHHVFTCHA